MCAACGEQHPPGTTTCPRTGTPVGIGPCGTVIDRYQVERWLGGGGAGAVYRARHTMIGQPVALKLMRPGLERDAVAMARFRREAQAAAAIGHPRIPRVLDLGVTPDGRPFLVMDLLEGRDLRSIVEAEAPLAVGRAVDLAVQVLEGLDAAHQAGIVHRDIKPANVFVVRGADGSEQVRLLDFGLSRMTEPERTSALTAAGSVLGTIYYMAPEQAAGSAEVDARADLYGTATMLYQMLSGVLPYTGDSVESVLVRIASAPAVPLAQVAPRVPASLASIVERGLQKAPAARWPTAKAFARALIEARDAVAAPPPPTRVVTAVEAPVATGPTPAPVTTPVAPPPPGRSRTGLVVGIVAAAVLIPLVVLLVLGAGASVFHTVQPPPAPVSGPLAPPTPPVFTPVAPPAALSGPENPPEVGAATLASMPVPRAPTPSDVKHPVTVGLPILEGPASESAVRRFLDRVRPSLADCRPTRADQRVRLRFSVDPTGAVARVPFAGNDADVVVSSCVASRIAAQRLPAAGATGGFRVEIGLLAR